MLEMLEMLEISKTTPTKDIKCTTGPCSQIYEMFRSFPDFTRFNQPGIVQSLKLRHHTRKFSDPPIGRLPATKLVATNHWANYYIDSLSRLGRL